MFNILGFPCANLGAQISVPPYPHLPTPREEEQDHVERDIRADTSQVTAGLTLFYCRLQRSSEIRVGGWLEVAPFNSLRMKRNVFRLMLSVTVSV